MKAPEVSIIVPVYNIENYLRQCIDSILAQTYTDFELLLVDDGSTDNCGSICDEYAAEDNRIIVIHKPNGGPASARNAGLEKVSGEWIMYVDGDDWIEPDFIQLLLEKAKETNADIAMSDFVFDYPDCSRPGSFYNWKRQGYDGLSEYITTAWTCMWGSIQRKSLYDDNGLRSPVEINFCEDFHLMVRLCFFAGKIAKVNKSLYHYRQRPTSIIHSLDNKKTQRDAMWVYSDIIQFFRNQGVYNDFRKAMAWRTLEVSQDLALDTATFEQFRNYNPDKKDHIFDCPYINAKLKIIAWCLTHGMSGIAAAIVRTRILLGR